MAETPKVLTALLAQLPDNTTGDISPEDIRDVVVSLFPSRGQLDLTAGGTTTFALTNTWYKLVCTTALDGGLGQDGFSQASNNEIRATKAVNQVLLCMATIEASSSGNNKTYSFTFAKNGTVISTAHVSEKFETSGAVKTMTVIALVPTVQNDTISVYVRNDTDTTSLTTANLTLSALGFIR